MAKFKPGESGNPSGRPSLPEDLKTVKLLTPLELRARIMRFLNMDAQSLAEAAADVRTNMLDRMIGSIVQKATEGGDQQRLDFILNRLVGKVSDKVEVTLPKPFVVTRASGEQVVMGAEKKEDE